MFKKIADYIKDHPEVVVLSAVVAVQTTLIYKTAQKNGEVSAYSFSAWTDGFNEGYDQCAAEINLLSQDTQAV